MAILTVGAGKTFARLSDAIAASRDGDVLRVQAGTYTNDFASVNAKITIEGVGGMVKLVATVAPPNGKGILVTNTDLTIRNFEFTGAAVPDANGAGIRHQAGNLVVESCYFHDNQEHILTNNESTITVTILRSEFANHNPPDGQAHSIYAGRIGKLEIRDSYFHDGTNGNMIKSRAAETIITGSRIYDNDSPVGYSIDLPNGGKATILNNTIMQGPNSPNRYIISYGTESAPMAGSSLLIQDNVIENFGGNGYAVLNRTALDVAFTGNKLYQMTRVVDGPSTQLGTIVLMAPVSLDRSAPWAAPVVSAGTASSVDVGASLAASSLFSVSDPDGNAITRYEFRDNGSGGGQLRLGGVGQASLTAIAVTADQLASLTYAGGTAAGSETIDIRASDGALWSSWFTVAVSTLQPNRAPVVSAGTASSVDVGASLAATSLFSVSDPDGNAITRYEFRDNGSGGGQLRLGGVGQASLTAIAVTADQLAGLTYAGGTAAGSETIDIRASDGALWSSWFTVAVATNAVVELPPVNAPPAITVAGISVAANQWMQASRLFSVSDPEGDAISAYRLTDLTEGSGYVWIGGVTQAANATLEVSASQFANVWFRGGATGPASDTLRIEAFDGRSWGVRDIAIATTPANRAPVAIATLGSGVSVGSSVPVTSIFTISDPDGDAITAYEFWDNAGGGQFRIAGIAQAAGSAIAVTPAQLASTVYEGAATAGSETIWARARDASLWSAWTGITFPTTKAPPGTINRAPVVSAGTASSVDVGASLAAASLFSVNDPDGNAITRYEFRDNGSGGGQLRLGGVGQASLTAIAVTADQLASLTYAGGTAAGSETIDIRASDGALWSSWFTVAVSTLQPNRAPVVSAGTASSVDVGASLAATSLFSVSDPDGNAITRYEFRDNGSGGGQLRLGGVGQASLTAIAVTADQLAGLTYAGGTAAGSETIDIRASDGALWSSWFTVAVSTLQPNRAPVVSAGTASSVDVGASLAASSLFSVSDPDGNAITRYEFRDNGSGGGQLRLGGVGQASLTAIAVTADQLAGLTYAGGTAAGSETIDIRASDGALWSSWFTVAVATNAVVELPPVNAPPAITTAGITVAANQWMQASRLFSVSDPEGDAISAYRLTDLTEGSGYVWIGGVTQAANATLEVSASQFANVWFRGGATGPASDTLRIEAFDGRSWGVREIAIATTPANHAPVAIATLGSGVSVGSSVPVTSIFTISDPDGDAITAYEFWDNAGGGQFRIAGIAQAAGSAIAVTPAQLASTVYEGAATAGSETIWARARDASLWSAWTGITFPTRAVAGVVEGIPDAPQFRTADLDLLHDIFERHDDDGQDTGRSDRQGWLASSGGNGSLADATLPPQANGEHGVLAGVLR